MSRCPTIRTSPAGRPPLGARKLTHLPRVELALVAAVEQDAASAGETPRDWLRAAILARMSPARRAALCFDSESQKSDK